MLEIKVCKITGKCPVYNSEDKSPADIIGINMNLKMDCP